MTAVTHPESIPFPTKPENSAKPSNKAGLLISLVLFVMAFYWFSGRSITNAIIIALCLLIHELGHFLAMRAYKYQDTKILFIPFLGALTIGQKEEVSQKQELIILLAGPIPGLLIGFILFFLGQLLTNHLLFTSGLIFVFLNAINLLPIYPLDGGRIIDTLYFGRRKIISKVFIAISIVLLIIFAIQQQEYFLLAIPVVLVLQLKGQLDIEKIKLNANHKGVRTNVRYEELTDEEYWLLRDEIGVLSKEFARFITPTVYEVSDHEPKVISYIQSILRKPIRLDLTKTGRFVFLAIWLLSIVISIILALQLFENYF
jgi:stage IV sporulation protein FB